MHSAATVAAVRALDFRARYYRVMHLRMDAVTRIQTHTQRKISIAPGSARYRKLTRNAKTAMFSHYAAATIELSACCFRSVYTMEALSSVRLLFAVLVQTKKRKNITNIIFWRTKHFIKYTLFYTHSNHSIWTHIAHAQRTCGVYLILRVASVRFCTPRAAPCTCFIKHTKWTPSPAELPPPSPH